MRPADPRPRAADTWPADYRTWPAGGRQIRSRPEAASQTRWPAGRERSWSIQAVGSSRLPLPWRPSPWVVSPRPLVGSNRPRPLQKIINRCLIVVDAALPGLGTDMSGEKAAIAQSNSRRGWLGYALIVVIALGVRLLFWSEVRGTPLDAWH